MGKSVMQLHHALQQDVGEKNPVLIALIEANLFDIEAAENKLFLANDAGLASATAPIALSP